MLKYIVIAALVVSSSAQAAPKKPEGWKQIEQREKILNSVPRSVYNICRGC